MDKYSSYQRLERLYKYHGLASGVFSADEHLDGNMPSQGMALMPVTSSYIGGCLGTELCAVVETLFSFETLFSIIGDPMFGEILK